MKKDPIHTSTACNAPVPPGNAEKLLPGCDCTSFCGDDPWIATGKAIPCATKIKGMQHTDRRNALSNVDILLERHGMLLKNNLHCYFELAYTRSSGWVAFIYDRPASRTTNTAEFSAGRKIISRGQGDTPDDACANALLALGTPA